MTFFLKWFDYYYVTLIILSDDKNPSVSIHVKYTWFPLAVWTYLHYRKTFNTGGDSSGIIQSCVLVLILSHIYSPFDAASISSVSPDHSEEAPPPQWLTPSSCVWLGHWCRTKLWHCTSQSKLCSLSLQYLGLIYSLMFMLNLLLWWLQQDPPPHLCQQ